MAPRRKSLTVVGGVVAVGILVGTVAVILLVKRSDNSESRGDPPDPTEPLPPSNSEMRAFDNAAISCDAPRCAQIGREILEDGGNTVDAAIGTLLCQGVIRSHSMGIGGGFLMVYYQKAEQKAYAIIARESAPANATEDMFNGDSNLSQKSALAVGVPGEMKGYWEMFNRFGSGKNGGGGNVSWSRIIDPTIEICKNGFLIDEHTANAIRSEEENIRKDPGMSEIFLDSNGEILKLNDIITRPALAKTLEKIASLGGDELYTGELAEWFVDDLQKLGGIITMDDMANYEISITDPVQVNISGGYTMFAVPPPGSGTLMAFVMKLLSEYDLSAGLARLGNPTETYHLIIEAFKHAYAKRTFMGDYLRDDEIKEEVLSLIGNLTSDDYLENIRKLIKLNSTSNDYEYYGAEYYTPDDHGTSHMSIVGPDGDAVACTSTINLYFGASIRSQRTGIIYNDEMDDFSAPNITNYFGVPPSPNNFIKPGKRPLSSMTPVVFVNEEGDVRLVVGAAGGTRITTATTLVSMRNLWFNETIKEAIDAPRVHHQLYPMEVSYEYGVLKQQVDGLRELGHIMTRSTSIAASCGVARGENGSFFANADFRKPGSIDGF